MTANQDGRRLRTPLALLSAGALSFLVAGAMAAAPALGDPSNGNGPPGANGTVKIDGIDFDHSPGNEPHVTCPFQITFWGFDAGTQDVTVAFTAQPPSGKFTPIDTTDGSDPLSFSFDTGTGAGNHLDASKTYGLDTDGLVEQPQQGFHVKAVVTVTGDGDASPAHGNATPKGQAVTSKSKVFWTTCTAPTPETSTPSSPSPSPSVSATVTPTVSPTQTEQGPVVLPTSTTRAPSTHAASPSPSTSVLGEKATRSQQLPFTGMPTGILLSAALGLILTGCGLVSLTRRSPAHVRR